MRISDWSSDVCSSDLRIGDTVFGRPAHPRGIICRGRSAEDLNRAVPSGCDRYDRWTSGGAGRGWRLDRRWMGEAGRSSRRCRPRTLGGLPDHRGPLDQGWLGGLGRASGALRRFGACAMGRRPGLWRRGVRRSEEHTSELQSLMRISYAVFCLKKKKKQYIKKLTNINTYKKH